MVPTIIEKMEWGTNENILDHRCGTGSSTKPLLLPIAEKTDSKLYGIDDCKSMIDYANEFFSDARIEYRVGELTSTPSPFGNLKFNKIFSLHTIHWVEDYKAELKALYEHLAPKGQMFVSVKLDAHFFELFKQLRNDGKWGDLAKEHLFVPQWLSETEDRAQVVRKAFEALGFEIEFFETDEKIHVSKSPADCANLVYSMNTFAKHLPEKEQEELNTLYKEFMIGKETSHHNPGPNSHNSEYKWSLKVLYILVRKP